MTLIACPALRSDDTLGFLAALGILELTTVVCRLPARLCWDGVGGAAIVDIGLRSTEALAETLHGVARTLAAEGRIVPVRDPGFLPPPLPDAERKALKDAGVHVGYDPLRLLPDGALRRYEATLEGEASGDLQTSRWLVALLSQLASERNGPARRLAPLYGPSGRMSLHQVYRDALAWVADDAESFQEALSRWRRRPGTGANLDSRALRDGAETADGRARNAAVPAASWLALMALPLFPQVTVAGGRAGAAGWDLAARGGPRLRWPIWRQPLDLAAVDVLLSHPALGRVLRSDDPAARRGTPATSRQRRRTAAALRALGVEAVCEARRQPLTNAAGALLPPSVVAVPVSEVEAGVVERRASD